MANRTVVENRCVWNNLPPGAPCDTNAQCRGNCENNVCVTTSTSGSSCASAFDGTCPNSLACVVEEAPPSVARQCLSRRPVNGYCRDPSDCISGVCDTDSNLCIAALQLEGGANCTDNYACKSGLCAVGTLGYRTCIDRPYSGGQGSPCPFGHTQCQMGYKCVGSPTVARCMNVRGLQCVSSTICGPNAECKCTGGTHYACQAADKPSLNCLTERVEYRKFTGSIFASLVRPWHLYPTDVAEAAAKLLCCEYRRGSFNNNEVKNRYLRGDGQVQPGARLNCRVDPPTWEERKTGDYPERCSLTSEVAFDNIWLL